MDKVQFGLSSVYFALVTISEQGVVSFGTPVAHPGAVNLTLDPTGSVNPFYADDIVYYRAQANQGYEGTMEFAKMSDWFKEEILGQNVNSDNVMVENNNDQTHPFAMLYKVKGDESGALRVLYYCEAGRMSENAATKTDTTDPQTDTVPITVMPLPDNGDVKAHTTDDTSETVKNGWFSEVYRESENPQLADLSGLQIGQLTLDPEFSSSVQDYEASTTNATNTITAVPVDENATVVIKNGDTVVPSGSAATWEEGENIVTIDVTNGPAHKIYTVVVSKS